MKPHDRLGLCFGTNLAMNLYKPVLGGKEVRRTVVGFVVFFFLNELFNEIVYLKEV